MTRSGAKRAAVAATLANGHAAESSQPRQNVGHDFLGQYEPVERVALLGGDEHADFPLGLGLAPAAGVAVVGGGGSLGGESSIDSKIVPGLSWVLQLC